jgi:hypothetical protein
MPIVPKVATLKATGGIPEIEIVVGHLHWATYHVLLFETNGANPRAIGDPHGQECTGGGSRLPLPGPVDALNGRSLFWSAALAAVAESGASAPFVATVRLLQDGKVVGLDGGAGALVSGQFQLTVEP